MTPDSSVRLTRLRTDSRVLLTKPRSKREKKALLKITKPILEVNTLLIWLPGQVLNIYNLFIGQKKQNKLQRGKESCPLAVKSKKVGDYKG